jgi:hypothetical protein
VKRGGCCCEILGVKYFFCCVEKHHQWCVLCGGVYCVVVYVVLWCGLYCVVVCVVLRCVLCGGVCCVKVCVV